MLLPNKVGLYRSHNCIRQPVAVFPIVPITIHACQHLGLPLILVSERVHPAEKHRLAQRTAIPQGPYIILLLLAYM